MSKRARRRWFQFSLRTMLIAAAVLAILWIGGSIKASGSRSSKRAYVFVLPRLQRIHGISCIAFAREPGVTFVCITRNGQWNTLAFPDDGGVEWQSSKASYRIIDR